jgi:aminoglycoside 3-N-acetyltransferase I
MRIERLTSGNRQKARALFAMMSKVFGEEAQTLSDEYIDRLLCQPTFYAMAAFAEDNVIGGITAHAIPMTTSESSEMFIYDVAVHEDHQRRGVGRQLLLSLLEKAAADGIQHAFVPVDEEDREAALFYEALKGTASPVKLYAWSKSPAPNAPAQPGN